MSGLDEIRARAEAASGGPWRLAHPRPDGRNLVERFGYDLYGGEVSEMIIVDTCPADADFIANARQDVPRLLAALEAVLDRCRASDDGSEHEHVEGCEGEPTCPACWAHDIRRAIREALQ